MQEKRGQLTIFIILAFVLVVAVFFIFTLNKGNLSGARADVSSELSTDELNVRNFIESCLEVTGKEALFYLGFVGGRLSPDPFEIYYSYDKDLEVPYFYIEGKNNIPLPYDENYWTNLVDRYIKNNFEGCIDDFKSFEGMTIEHGNVDSATGLTDTSVIFNIDFPVTIIRNFNADKLDSKYTDEINVRLREMLNVATTIVEQEVKDDKYIHWDYLTQVSVNNYNITAYTEEDDTIVYRIIDLQNRIDDEPYVFQWANKIRTAPIE